MFYVLSFVFLLLCLSVSIDVFSITKYLSRFCHTRSYTEELSRSNIVNANTMVQIAINRALKMETSKYNKKKFERAVDFALTQTKKHDGFLTEVKEAFAKAGVALVVLPNLKNSGINGATKKVDGKVMIMVNDRRHYADTFWFTLFHEIGHVLNGDLGITFKNEAEDEADLYAQRSLIPEEAYVEFKNQKQSFTEDDIRSFANAIDQDPGIVYGRLQKDSIFGDLPFR